MKCALYISGALLIVGAFVALPYVGGVLPLVTQPTPREAELLFGGDVMFDRYIRDVSERRGQVYVLSCLSDVLNSADYTVVNLEGPITEYESTSRGTRDGEPGHYRFTFPPETAATLRGSGVDVAHVGNNHMRDFGSEGIAQTIATLTAAGVQHFGNPNDTPEMRTYATTVRGVPITFVSWNDWAQAEAAAVASIAGARASRSVPIVYTHWGDEYVGAPERVRVLAHRFVDAGAALIIGSHSHVEGEYERYQGVDIYYSLGNLVFDQYFSEEVRNGILVRAIIKDGVVTTERIPVRLETDGRTCLRNLL
ncbi:MAG: CapA family protein [Candidatus Pacebacteria bacterium]|nr:CapA family protein [Candidatus Paceibacterota bacterium]